MKPFDLEAPSTTASTQNEASQSSIESSLAEMSTSTQESSTSVIVSVESKEGPTTPRVQLSTLRAVLRCETAIELRELDDAIFVCFDFEQFEFDQGKVLEIGISVLDTRDLPATVENEESLYKCLRFAHFLISDYQKLVNRRWVKGCPRDFLFGDTQLITLSNTKKILRRVFNDPTKLNVAADFEQDISDAGRQIILVGHALSNDTKTSTKLGTAPFNIVAHVDTQRLPAGTTKNRLPRLSLLLEALGIEASFLHNAGNDAAYTLMAMASLAIQPADLVAGNIKQLLVKRDLETEAMIAARKEK